MLRLHNRHIGFAFILTLLSSAYAPCLPDSSYNTLIFGIVFIALVHNVFVAANGGYHESFMVVRNVYGRCVGK